MYPTVETSTTSSVAGNKDNKLKWSELTSEQKAISRHLERSKTMTRDAYMKQLKEIGAI